MSIHVAAIVKGLVEQGDGTAHFGSLMGYGYHANVAKKCRGGCRRAKRVGGDAAGAGMVRVRANVRIE